VLRRYARTLNNFLCMPLSKLPLKPILTGSYPRWYGKGDEVAVYDRGEWWHAVVIDDVKPKSKKVRIFWVGYDEHETRNIRIANLEDSLYQNPCYVSTHNIRSVSEMASPKAGSLADFDVSWIQRKYCGIADDAQESEATSSSAKAADGDHANAAACKAKKGKGAAAATRVPSKKKRKKQRRDRPKPAPPLKKSGAGGDANDGDCDSESGDSSSSSSSSSSFDSSSSSSSVPQIPHSSHRVDCLTYHIRHTARAY
jgi:hypothetical protein